jgi:hypothetical protein
MLNAAKLLPDRSTQSGLQLFAGSNPQRGQAARSVIQLPIGALPFYRKLCRIEKVSLTADLFNFDLHFYLQNVEEITR